MHRFLSLAAALLAVVVTAAPGHAEDSMRLDDAQALYASTKISGDADIALYCASAFNLLALHAVSTNDAGNAKAFHDRSVKLLTEAQRLLTGEGVSDEQGIKLNEAVATIVTAEIVNGTDKPKYSRDQCTSLAAKLK